MENITAKSTSAAFSGFSAPSKQLAMRRDSHGISKMKPKIRIIHIVAPKIIKTDVENFRCLVQRLTGKSDEVKGRMKKARGAAARRTSTISSGAHRCPELWTNMQPALQDHQGLETKKDVVVQYLCKGMSDGSVGKFGGFGDPMDINFIQDLSQFVL